MAAVVLAQDAGAPIPAPVATPDPPSSPQLPPSVPTPVTPATPSTPKKTPGRHCRLREGCADCLALSYCVWSPSTSKCLDKHKATRKDDVVSTCDPVVCAKHGGKPVDNRKAAHTSAQLGGVRGKRVIADAEVVERLPAKAKYDPLPHLKRKNRKVSFPRTTSDDAHVRIKRGKKHFIFESDNRGPIIRGEAEERKRRWLAEKRLHRKLVIKKLLEQQHLLSKPKKSKFRTPEYYPTKKEKLAAKKRDTRLKLAADQRIKRDAELRAKLEKLRRRANRALKAKRYLVSNKRNKIEAILARLSTEIDKVNQQAIVIDNDDAAFAKISKDVDALSAKVKSVCDTTFALLEEQAAMEE